MCCVCRPNDYVSEYDAHTVHYDKFGYNSPNKILNKITFNVINYHNFQLTAGCFFSVVIENNGAIFN